MRASVKIQNLYDGLHTRLQQRRLARTVETSSRRGSRGWSESKANQWAIRYDSLLPRENTRPMSFMILIAFRLYIP